MPNSSAMLFWIGVPAHACAALQESGLHLYRVCCQEMHTKQHASVWCQQILFVKANKCLA